MFASPKPVSSSSEDVFWLLGLAEKNVLEFVLRGGVLTALNKSV